MFLGEYLCMITFVLMKFVIFRNQEIDDSRPYSPFIFILPACCDMTGTSLMYIGLTMTGPSVFQMLRGSVVVFTGILSVVFLKRRLQAFHWAAMGMVIVGVAIVGYASISNSSSDDSSPSNSTRTNSTNPYPGCGTDSGKKDQAILGNMLIIGAQVITAVQMCIEEKFVGGYNIPALAAVGWEGFWGFCVISCALLGLYFVSDDSKPTCKFEDSIDAFVQLSNNGIIVVAIVGNILSIAAFNFFGISVTKVMSAAHRMVLDSVRTFVIWGASLAIGWEEFYPLQLVGFTILLIGTGVYNELIMLPGFHYETNDPDLEGRRDACCGAFSVHYVYVPLADNIEPCDPDGHLAPAERMPKNSKGASFHRSFTTIDELHQSFAKDEKDIEHSSLVDTPFKGTPHSSFTGSFLGVGR